MDISSISVVRFWADFVAYIASTKENQIDFMIQCSEMVNRINAKSKDQVTGFLKDSEFIQLILTHMNEKTDFSAIKFLG